MIAWTLFAHPESRSLSAMSSAPCFMVTMTRDGRGTWNKDDRRERVNQVGEVLGVPGIGGSIIPPKAESEFLGKRPPISCVLPFQLFTEKEPRKYIYLDFQLKKTLGLWLYFEHDVTGAARPPLPFDVILLAYKSAVDHDVSTFFGQALLRRFGSLE